jgi:hypothetical protein
MKEWGDRFFWYAARQSIVAAASIVQLGEETAQGLAVAAGLQG